MRKQCEINVCQTQVRGKESNGKYWRLVKIGAEIECTSKPHPMTMCHDALYLALVHPYGKPM